MFLIQKKVLFFHIGLEHHISGSSTAVGSEADIKKARKALFSKYLTVFPDFYYVFQKLHVLTHFIASPLQSITQTDFSNNFYELENQNVSNQKLAIFDHLCVELSLS